MEYQYIVIEREYGSGGTEVGKLVSEKLGISCYGEEILEAVSHKLGLPVEYIREYEEKPTNSFLYSLYSLGQISSGMAVMPSHEMQIYAEEQRIIKEYAAKGSAVFVGRCASQALTDRKVLNVFIRADKEKRIRRAIEQYGISDDEVKSVVETFDRRRSVYYNANTGKKWHDISNYALVLDSGILSLEKCAEIICQAVK